MPSMNSSRARPGAGVDIVVRNPLTGPVVAPHPAPAVFDASGAPSAAPGADGAVSGPIPGGGAGVRGMAERALALGGTFDAAPADGWFVVRAHMPWQVVPPQRAGAAPGVGGGP